jgi:spore germination protein
MITSTYAASKGITNLGRIFVFLGIIIILMALTIHTVMFILGDIKNIRPFYDPSETGTYLRGISTTVIAFLGYEVLTVIPLTKQNGKKVIFYSAGAILAAGLFYSFIIESCYAILGIDDIVNYKDALIVAIRRIDAPFFQFLKRLDIIFIFAWLMAIFSTLSILIYTLNEYSCKLLSRVNKFTVLIIMAVLVFIASLLPQNLDSASAILSLFTGYTGLIPAFLIPLILLIIAKVKKNAHKA